MELHGLATLKCKFPLPNWNRPYLEMVMSKFDENGTDRKPSLSAFDRYHFYQIWTSPSRDMSDSSQCLRSLDLVESVR